MNQYKRWTNKEIKLLQQHYTQGGINQAAPHLPNRTRKAIESKASKLMIYATDQDHLIPLRRLHTRTSNECSKRAITQAKKDKQLIITPHARARYHVTREWALKYAQQLQREQQTRQLTRNWHTSTQLAQALNTTRKTVLTQLLYALKPKPKMKGSTGKLIILYTNPIQNYNPKHGQPEWKFHPKGTKLLTQKVKANMKCPNCHKHKTIVTRTTDDGIEITRDRKCNHCNHKYKTLELTYNDYKKALQRMYTNNPHLK